MLTRHQNNKLPSDLLWSVALVAAWLIATTLAFFIKKTQLLIGFDGGFLLNVAQRQFAWHVPLLSASLDWFQGLGDIFLGVNFRLLPAFIAGALFTDTTAAKVAIYEVVLCELSGAIVLFGLALGASRAVAVAAALATCLTFLPFAHPTLLYGIVAIAPNIGSLMAGALLAAAAFIQYGRRGLVADLPYAAIVLVLLSWMALVSITNVLLSGPVLLLCAVSGTIAAGDAAERRCKIGLFAAAALFLVAPAIYLVGTILDTAAVIFPAELANNRATFYFASILFQWQSVGPVGPLLVMFAIAGAALAAVDRTRPRLRIFAITLLTYLGTRLTFAVLIIVFDFWRGPAALYFEFFVIPLYALFAAVFWAWLFERLWRLRHWALPSGIQVEAWLVGAAAVLALVLAAVTSHRDYGFPYPPQPTAITNLLARETALQPGAVFRGRTADMIGRSVDRPIDWLDLHGMDGALADATGNELRLVGLNYFGVPSLVQYTPTITPFLYGATTRLLALPGDRQARSQIVLRDFNPRILAMLGVRFVITDSEYDGAARLRLSVPGKERTLLLYEIADPNLGDYSPTAVTRIGTAPEVVARIAEPNFDPTREIIADIPGEAGGLVIARDARLTFRGASLRLKADSDGRSILLIPLEFSRCLEATPIAGAKPLLFRANLVETGVLFSGRLDIALAIRTGPFIDPACRLEDWRDARALQVGAVPERTAQPEVPAAIDDNRR